MTRATSKFRLGDITRFVSGSTPSKQASRYWGGNTPWVSAKDLKALHINSAIDTLSESGRDAASLVPPGTLLILVRGMTLFKSIPIGIASRELAINQDLKGLITNDAISPQFLAYSLLAKESELLQMVEAAGHGTGKLDTDVLKDVWIQVPSLADQLQISRAISTWETAIQETERLIRAKEHHLTHFRDRLLHNPQKALPIKLCEITKELTARNGSSLGRDAIMAVTKQSGMRPMRKETIAANIKRYKRVPPSAFAYNPMRLNIGSISISPFDYEVLVSPDYVVFACDESKLLPRYLHHMRFTQHWIGHFETAGNGGVRVRIYYDDLGGFSFKLPPVTTQQKIVNYLDAAESEIELLRKKAETLRIQRRGLMRKLLTGEWRLPAHKEATS